MGFKNRNVVFITIFFLANYFCLEYFEVDKIVELFAIGIFTGTFSYVIYQKSYTFFLKISVTLFLLLLIIALSFLFKNDANKSNVSFSGVWLTDSSGGYSIQMKIVDDSAYLSQSNSPEMQSFKISLEPNSFNLENEKLNKYYQWQYKLKDNSLLILFKKDDTLIFNKIIPKQ